MMSKLFAILFLSVAVTSCQAQETDDPAPRQKVLHTYEMGKVGDCTMWYVITGFSENLTSGAEVMICPIGRTAAKIQ